MPRSIAACLPAFFLLAGCTLYQSPDRDSFNQNALAGAPKKASISVSEEEASSLGAVACDHLFDLEAIASAGLPFGESATARSIEIKDDTIIAILGQRLEGSGEDVSPKEDGLPAQVLDPAEGHETAVVCRFEWPTDLTVSKQDELLSLAQAMVERLTRERQILAP